LRQKALDRGAFAFMFKPFHGVDVDRQLHALFNLKMPLLTTAASTVWRAGDIPGIRVNPASRH
jgi:hypothetical protein